MDKLLQHLNQWCLLGIDDVNAFNDDVQRGISKGWISTALANQWFDLDEHTQANIFNQLKQQYDDTWYGYTEQEYTDLVKQPNDPEWADLKEADE